MTPVEDKLFEVAERSARVEAQVTGIHDGMKQLSAQSQQILSHLNDLKGRDIERKAHLDNLEGRLAEVEKTQSEHKDLISQARGGKKALVVASAIGVGVYQVLSYILLALHIKIQ